MAEARIDSEAAAASSAARPWSQTAQTAASSSGKPGCAAKAARIPVSVSPLPAVAMAGVPVGLMTARRLANAVMVRSPFRMRVTWCWWAKSSARSRRRS